jgi:CRP/FNR family transcriptional regulator, cyclic AMP receptor protein
MTTLVSTSGRKQYNLDAHRWFAALPGDIKQEVSRRGRLRQVPARALVYAAGSAPAGMFAVLSGEVRLEHYTKSGKFAFYKAMRSGEPFGLLSELDGSPRFSNARASVDTDLLHLAHAEFQDLYQNHPRARDAFVRLICENLHTTLDMLVEEHSAPPRAQIAQILVSIFSRADEANTASPKLTQEALAAMAGVSRQTTSKVLHELRAQGLIAMQYGKIEALDLAALERVARTHNTR